MEVEQRLRQELVKHSVVRREAGQSFYLSLAQELAMEITPVMDVLKSHGLSEDQFNDIARSPVFQRYFQEAQVAWGATSSAPLRVRAKMEAMVEQSLPNLFKELLADGLTGPKVELIKAMMKGGGIGEASKEVAREGVSIVINMDASKPEKEIKVVTIDHNADDM